MYVGVVCTRRLLVAGSRWTQLRLASAEHRPEPAKSSSIVFSTNSSINSYLQAAYEKTLRLMSVYEEAIGLKEIREAQQKVLEVSGGQVCRGNFMSQS